MAFQSVEDAVVNRTEHVWRRIRLGPGIAYKCVICGAVSFDPCDEAKLLRYDKLTDEERKLCPPMLDKLKSGPATEVK